MSKKNKKEKPITKQPAVSILVPIYNTEKYLRQCLESITNQTLKNIEIICIDDGSTDKSPEIIKEYQEKDSRIKVITKENSGYGDSMNQGLEKVTGEYIGIVEPDDFVDLNAFESLYNLAKDNDAEIVRTNYYHNKDNKDTKFFYVNPTDANRIIDPSRHIWIFYQAPAIWSAIYKRELIIDNEIKFLPTPGASYQDTGFNFKAWSLTKRAFFTTEAFLHYRVDNESSSVNNPGKVMNVCYEYEEIEKFLRKNNLFESLGPVMEVAKFGAYYWNIWRLSSKLRKGFIERTKKEFTEAQAEGMIIETYKAGIPQWDLLMYILNHSVGQSVRHVTWLKIYHGTRTKIKKFWLKFRPTYRKQLEIAELIAELCSESDILEAKIRNLEKKIHEDTQS